MSMDTLAVDKPWLMLGDCLERMKEIPDGSVDLTVTSPPYDNLRKYNGYSFDFEGVASELHRVTKPGGVVVWVVSDATVNGSETGTSFRQALFFRDVCEFSLHDTMIWHKGFASIPTPDRYYNVFEYMFVFSKGKPNALNLLADRENKHVGRAWKAEACIGKVRRGRTADSRTRITPKYSRRYNIWQQYTVSLIKEGRKHPAAFPEQLAADHIASWSNPGDIVLDPFTGSGTTGKMAVLAGRKFIGVEISDQYLDIARKRIDAAIAVASQPAPLGGLFDAQAAE